MTNTIEVPRDLIEAGDWDAIKALLPQPESYFGRWATHREYGRVLCISDCPWKGKVSVSYKGLTGSDGVGRDLASLADLTFDPLTLTTAEDFENAPVGTIVENDSNFPALKLIDGAWVSQSLCRGYVMADLGPWSVVRWGRGDQE